MGSAILTPAAFWLAANLYYEARGVEDLTEWNAICWVVLNRTKDSHFPNNIIDVIAQPKQFSWTSAIRIKENNLPAILTNGAPDTEAWKEVKRFAVWFLGAANAGYLPDPTKGALFYATKRTSPKKISNTLLKLTLTTTAHKFYRPVLDK